MFANIKAELDHWAQDAREYAMALSDEAAFMAYAGHAFSLNSADGAMIEFNRTQVGDLRAFWANAQGEKVQLVLDAELRLTVKTVAAMVLSRPFTQAAMAAAMASFADEGVEPAAA